MELLAPAGDMKQALKSIEAGCDAIYGGLKGWNARQRASNFSVEEYNQILELCHERGIKFYLTLNTLFRDDELNEIQKLFVSSDFRHPDAVIVADIGLMRMFSHEFPDVVLHASTQFGAYSVEDFAFLKQFHVKRAVLARELTLSEIRELRKNTDMELEIFVYGSQCVCFSGQCLWGGLMNGCSGNRGRCTGMCRDIYCMDGHMGQFMYPRDINAIEMLRTFQNIGIDSVKIEGRIRNVDETFEAVRGFREALESCACNISQGQKKYVGYLSDRLPVKNMINVVNPRFVFPTEYSSDYGEHDIIFADKPVPGIYNGKTVNSQECRFMMSAFTDKSISSDMAVSVSLDFKNRFPDKIVMIDGVGSRQVFGLSGLHYKSATLTDVYKYIHKNMKVNMYEFLSNVPQNEMVNIDWNELASVIQKMSMLCECGTRESVEKKECFSVLPSIQEIVVQTDNAEDIDLILRRGIKKYIFEFKSRRSFLEAVQKERADTVTIYKLPVLDFNHVMDDILPLLRGKHVLISRPSQLMWVDQFSFSAVYADYTVSVWNTYAAEILKSRGVVSFTAHPELSAEYSALLSKRVGLSCSIIEWGKIPLGFTRACFGENGLCRGNCVDSVFSLENIAKGYNIEIRCDNDFGYRSITGPIASMSKKDEGVFEYRWILEGLNQEERHGLIERNILEEKAKINIYRRSVR